MKKLALLFVLAFCVNSVFADNLFQNSNPFPQNNPERMNNLYEAEQSSLLHEKKQEKKSWFRKGKNLQEQEIQETEKRLYTYPQGADKNEGVQSGSFYMFQ